MTALNSLRHAVQNASEMGPRAQMRAALPHLDDLVRRGTTYEILISALGELGMIVQLNSLRMAVYRWRKAQGEVGPSAAAAQPHRQAISRQPLVQPQPDAGRSTAAASAGIPPGVPVREYLRQLRNAPVDPAEEARRDREWRKTQAARTEAEEQAKKKGA